MTIWQEILMNRVFLMVVCALSLLVPAMPAFAQFQGGAFTSVRREYHRETGDFRLSAELYAPGYDEPYWAWLGATREWLKVPQIGYGRFSFILVTDDGKPVRHAKWSIDNRKPVSEWNDLVYGHNGFELNINLSNARRGNHTVFFAGSIKGGSKDYTKVWLLVDITIGGKKKDRRQIEALQFAVYSIEARGRIDELTLVNAQEQMGAGGTSLIGPEIVDEEDQGDDKDRRDRREDRNDRRVDRRNNNSDLRTIQLCFKGFTSWTRIEWDNGKTEYLKVGESTPLRVPDGAKSLNLYIVDSDRQATGGYRVKYDGRETPYPASAPEITVTRTAR